MVYVSVSVGDVPFPSFPHDTSVVSYPSPPSLSPADVEPASHCDSSQRGAMVELGRVRVRARLASYYDEECQRGVMV